MLTPPQIVWVAHGEPRVDACESGGGRCYVCSGVVTRGQLVTKWLGSNYTDQHRARNPLARYVCEACVYIHSRTAPVLGRPAKEGKKFGGNHRNYSHMWEDGWEAPAFGDDGAVAPGYANASKGQKPLIREFLQREHVAPWFAAIADSGQKHVLPFAPMNGPGRGGRVQFDDRIVVVPSDTSLIAAMVELLTDGVTKDEIGSGNYTIRSMRERVESVRAFESVHGSGRGGGWFTLALWVAQRNEEEHARRCAEKEARNARGRDGAGVSGRLPKRAKRTPAARVLGPAAGQDPGSGETDDNRQRVGQPGSAPAPDSGPAKKQLGLFD